MKKASSKKHYIFSIKEELPKQEVHLVQSTKAADFTSLLKLFEYFATGNPIVATEISSLMEFKHTPAIAAWCEPDHPTKFAESLKYVLETRPRKIAVYTDIIEFVKQFSWENRAAKILSYVDESLHPQIIS